MISPGIRWALLLIVALGLVSVRADDPPQFLDLTISNGQAVINFTPHPEAQSYYLLSGTNVNQALATNAAAALGGFTWTVPATNLLQFYSLKTVPASSNAILSALVLNRLAYGPTPDELQRLAIIQPQAYIDEQLAPESITEDVDNTHTNLAFIQAKFLEPTELLAVLLTSNIVAVVTNTVTDYSVTSTTILMTNDGTQYYQLSTSTANYSTNAATASATNVTTTSASSATISDLRAWHVLRAVGARRQLLEILLQFLENHFVTQYSKSSTYLNNFYNGDNTVREDRIATQWEYLENEKWRNALLDPNCTFYDLLKISAESPAMIVYLDTVSSRSDGSRIANENYGRELLELFTFGVDNGYDQTDITTMSRSWAGWTVDVVSPANAGNPLTLPTTNRVAGAVNGGKTNLLGVWAFYFRTNFANTTNKLGPIFAGKTVPARFGPPWAGVNYQLDIRITNINNSILTNKSVNSGTAQSNAIQAGYSVIRHLANQPFTMEYMSVKLCRLFVHDNFPNPTTKSDQPEYAFYDYTSPNLSPEADLVHQCMVAWDTPGPDGRKGNIRSVLRTIFNSDLFRTNANLQKIKTPLEFAVSTIRVLRANTNASGIVNATNFTARTDGYAIVYNSATVNSAVAAPGNAPLTRMGNMLLFERDAPDGYPEIAAPWISAGALAERLRFVQSVMIAGTNATLTSNQTGKSDAGLNNLTDPVGLLKAKLPNTSWTNAPAVADYFISIIFPAEGQANLNQYRAAAINFLNTGDNGATSAPFNTASQTGSLSTPSAYDTRVRGMVSMLLTFQRFQEQ